MDELQDWLDKVEAYHLPRFEDLPELDLYRDQLLTLVDKYIEPIWLEDSPVVTTSMVNNYVKNGLLPHPEKKFQKFYSLTPLGEIEFANRKKLLKHKIEESLKVFQIVYKDLYL